MAIITSTVYLFTGLNIIIKLELTSHKLHIQIIKMAPRYLMEFEDYVYMGGAMVIAKLTCFGECKS